MKKILLLSFITITYFTSCKKQDTTPVSNSPTSTTTTTTTTPLTKHVVGEKYQGGIVFYLTDTSGQHGMIVSEIDNGQGGGWATMEAKSGFGTGKFNTDLLNTKYYKDYYTSDSSVNVSNGIKYPKSAAQMCHNLTLNGYNDWYQPSTDEIKVIYNSSKTNTNIIFTGDYIGSNTSTGFIFTITSTGSTKLAYSSEFHNVRAIRNF